MLVTIQTTTNIEYHPYNLCRYITETVIIAAIVQDDFHIWYVLVMHIYFILLLFGIFGFKMYIELTVIYLQHGLIFIRFFLLCYKFVFFNFAYGIWVPSICSQAVPLSPFTVIVQNFIGHSNGSWADIRYLLAVIRSCSFVSIYHLLSDLFGHSNGSCYYKLSYFAYDFLDALRQIFVMQSNHGVDNGEGLPLIYKVCHCQLWLVQGLHVIW